MKGQLADIGTYIILGVVIAISFLLGWFVMDTWNEEVATSDVFGTTAKQVNADTFGNFGTNFDNMFMLIYIGILIGTLVLSYVLRTAPGLFFVLLIIVFIFGIVAGYMGNAWTAVSEQSALAGAAASFPITSFIMDNYLLLTIINAFLMIIVFFAKPDDGGGF